MIINSVRVRNYRSILDAELECGNITSLVGRNGAGKSAFLGALEYFYYPSKEPAQEDFYDEDTTVELSVAVTFSELSDEAKERFLSYLQGSTLTVERVFTMTDGKCKWSYHGARLQNPDFVGVREGVQVKDRSKTAKEAYNKLRSMECYKSFPDWSSNETILDYLKKWEEDNPEGCTRARDDGQFFGFKEVGQGYLGHYSRYLFIPAVKDASEDSKDSRGSSLTELLDLVVRSRIASGERIGDLKEETQSKLNELFDPEKVTELGTLADDLTETLCTFVPDTKVDLLWQPIGQINLPIPSADIKLTEDGYASPVDRTGHGLQRAFILTLLQHLLTAQDRARTSETFGELPDLVLAIEEPEMYQHPNRQRHFADVLAQLAAGSIPGVADRTQVLYTTHSPLFVSVDRIEQMRLVRKSESEEGKPKESRVASIDLDNIAKMSWTYDGKPGETYTATTLRSRLRAIMTPWMNEGFFAEKVVLVEGEDDRAAILGVAKANGYNLDAKGIAVIPCGGKTNIANPYMIFRELGIDVYLIWDSDKNLGSTEGHCETCGKRLDKRANPSENRRLLRLLDIVEEDWPCHCTAESACFEENLEATLENEIGSEAYEAYLEKCKIEFGILKNKHAVKNPQLIEALIGMAREHGKTSRTLESIVAAIVNS